MLVALPGGISRVLAQDNTPKRGFQPANSFALSDVETINTTNGNLILNFPIGSLPSGRGGMSATMRLLYNSKLYDSYPEWVVWYGGNPSPQVVQQNHLTPSGEGGWRYGTGYQLLLFNKMDQYAGLPGDLPPGTNPTPQCYPVANPAATHIWKLKIAFPDGSAHEMIPLGYTNYQGEGYYEIRPDGFFETCQGGYWTSNDLTYYSVDGTFLKLVIKYNPAHNGWWNNEWTLYFPDGGRVTYNEPGAGGQRVYDRNNNYTGHWRK